MHFGSENMSVTNKILMSYHPFVACHLTLLLHLGLRTHTCSSGDHYGNHGEIQTLRTLWFNILNPSEHDFIAQSTCEFDKGTGETTSRRFCTLGSGIMDYLHRDW